MVKKENDRGIILLKSMSSKFENVLKNFKH